MTNLVPPGIRKIPQEGVARDLVSDELTLLELWALILRHKWALILTPLICVSAGMLYVLLAPTVYQSRAMLQVGSLPGHALSEGEEVAIRLTSQYTPVDTELANHQLPRLARVTVDSADAGILTLDARGRTPREAQKYLQDILDNFLARRERTYVHVVAARQQQLARLQADLRSLQTTLRHNPVGATSAVGLAGLLRQAQQSEVYSALLSLNGSIDRIENELEAGVPPTEILTPRYDPTAVKPRRWFILGLSFVGGVMLGVCLVLISNANLSRSV
ncbi:MAG: Wzz/FepE/Etk N-terminal domain-containing protein [Betaproteobacteria bacterium]|nr:Wzz/FepE/Etk N-terminal domain-containing protein [Betaproteobacteria bacterium]